MIVRKRRRVWSALPVLLLLVLAGGLAPAAHAAPAPTPEYSPPAPEASPFTSADAFCVPSLDNFESVAPKGPPVSGRIVVVMMTPGADTAVPGAGDPAKEAQTFAALVNRCGGIGGRKLDLRVRPETGDPVADCLATTQLLRALVVASLSASPTQGCVTRDQRTVMITGSDVSNADLAATGGRLVATGSTEGVQQARLLDIISSGRLDGRHVAVVAGTSPSDQEFARVATTMLKLNKIRIASEARADTLLEPAVDPATIGALQAATATRTRQGSVQLYGFSDTTPELLDQLRQFGGSDLGTTFANTNIYSFTPVADQQYRDSRAPNAFSEMCNKAYSTASATGTSTTTTSTTQPGGGIGADYLQITRVCLTMRIVARGLFNAGIDLNQQSLIKALHRLPYIDSDTPAGTPKPRPNQIVNEPVARIEQVVVLSQAQVPCASSSTTSTSVVGSICWAPVSGWDDGGKVVNARMVAIPSS